MDHLEELQALRRELEQANYEYYVQDAPAMSDYDYDHKLRRLEELEGEHPELITPDSPTQRVGGKALESFQQVIHQVPLESLQDVFDYDELRQFDQRVRAAVPGAEAFRFRQDGIHWEVWPSRTGAPCSSPTMAAGTCLSGSRRSPKCSHKQANHKEVRPI